MAVALPRPAPNVGGSSEQRVFQTREPSSRRARRASLLALIGFVGLCLLVSAAGGALSGGGVQGWVRRPLFGAPEWMFAPAWTLLHVTTGVAAWLVWRRVEVGLHRKRAALRLWGWQLLACALWPAAFFGLHTPGVALAVIVAAALGVGLTMRACWRLQRMAAGLMLPYAAWIGFGTWLNAGFWWLGHGSAILGP